MLVCQHFKSNFVTFVSITLEMCVLETSNFMHTWHLCTLHSDLNNLDSVPSILHLAVKFVSFLPHSIQQFVKYKL